MQPLKITVSSTRAVCSERPDPITTGMVGLRAEFTFSEDWDGLKKTAVCAGSGVAKDVMVIQDAITVPPECLTDPASDLKIGLYGTNSTGNIVIPTVYAYCGRLFRGADPSGDTSTDYTLPIWAQLQAMMGSLDNLTTTAKENLVAAINEAAKSGGGGAGIVIDSTLTKSGQAADAAAVGNRLSALSEEIVTTAESKVSAHNTGTDTHSDIRLLIQGLTDRLNALADSDDATLDQLSEIVAYIKSNRDLISAITTSKVNVADIVDNLTTNVANKPLSAAQGVALKALIDAITIPETLPNPNALTFTGAVTGSYDGSAPLEVAIPSGGGSSDSVVFANDILAEGTVSSGLAAWSNVDTGVTPQELRSYKSFAIYYLGMTGRTYATLCGQALGQLTNILLFEWEDSAKTILRLIAADNGKTNLFNKDYREDLTNPTYQSPFCPIRTDFRNATDKNLKFITSQGTTTEATYQIVGWTK